MQITIINDCRDQNAKLRQVSRTGSLFKNCSVNCFGAESKFEAAGFLVDAIDAFEGRKGIILANFARREEKKPGWKNGSPFGFFWHKNTLIVSSLDSFVLSLAKKLGVIKELFVLDIIQVLESSQDGKIDEKTKERIANSQFRSFDFLPRAAYWLYGKENIPCRKYDLSEIEDVPKTVWFVDNFGNIKTTILKEELNLDKKNVVKIKIGKKERDTILYGCLKDVPDKTIGLVFGSSGIGEKRFLEIVMQGGSAAEKLGVKTGDRIEILQRG